MDRHAVLLYRAKDLIRKLLETCPEKRLTASQALQHEWILESMEEEKLPDLSNTRAKLARKDTEPHRFRVSAGPCFLSANLLPIPNPATSCFLGRL